MEKSISDILKKVFSITDILAGICFFSIMALVVVNIIMRNVFIMPILGTVEIVGLLTATGLGLAMANCEMADFNIGMDVLTEKFSRRAQRVIASVIYVISLCFWAIVAWRVFVYASTSFTNGRVTATASIPLYPFIFILGFNVFCLCIVLVYKLIGAIKDASAKTGESACEAEEGSK